MAYYYGDRNIEKRVLTEGLDIQQLRKLLVQRPSMFDLNSVAASRRSVLLSSDHNFYSKYIDFYKLPQSYQVEIALAKPGAFATKINWSEMNACQRNIVAHRRPLWFKKYKT